MFWFEILKVLKDKSVVSMNVASIFVPTSSGVRAQEMKNQLVTWNVKCLSHKYVLLSQLSLNIKIKQMANQQENVKEQPHPALLFHLCFIVLFQYCFHFWLIVLFHFNLFHSSFLNHLLSWPKISSSVIWKLVVIITREQCNLPLFSLEIGLDGS